jgi:exodeoxyribonuclease V gamma subunit
LLLLQWLLAARDVFYASYTGQDTGSGEELAPSTALAELLDFVASNQFANVPRREALARLITRQPMQPFSPRYFAAPGDVVVKQPRVFTFRGEWRPGTAALFGSRGVQPRLVDDSRAPRPEIAELALGELKRFFDRPPRYFLREVLQLELEITDNRISDEEPLQLDRKQEHRLRQALFASARATGPLSDMPDARVRAQGVLPPPPLDVEPYRKLAGELNALLPVWTRACAVEEPAAVAIDVPLAGGLRLVGRIGDAFPDGLRRIDARRLGARQLLGHWIDLLALAATGHPGRLTCCGFDKDGALDLRVGSVDPTAALEHLGRLVELYLEGQQRPICFMPDLALGYLERLGKGAAPDDALAKCNGKLTDEFRTTWEATDPWYAALLAEPPDPLGAVAESSEFCATASTVLGPMLTTLAQLRVEDWLAAPSTTG